MRKGIVLIAVVIAAIINAVACQDVTFRTKETDEPAPVAFAAEEALAEESKKDGEILPETGEA